MTKDIPTAAKDVLQQFLESINGVNPGFIKGMYLTGSIPLNDYRPGKSDIDFIILCNELPGGNDLFEIEELHKRIYRKFKTANLNGHYVTPRSLDVHHLQPSGTLYIQDGRMNVSAFEMAPVTLYELRTTAITVCGIPADQLAISIELEDVNKFLFENMNTYWKNWIATHSSLLKRKLILILFPRLSEWAILGMARQLYTLKTGKITSKTNAGYFCTDMVPAHYQKILQNAIEIRNDNRKYGMHIKPSYYVQPSVKRARETIACANSIIQRFNEEYRNKN